MGLYEYVKTLDLKDVTVRDINKMNATELRKFALASQKELKQMRINHNRGHSKVVLPPFEPVKHEVKVKDLIGTADAKHPKRENTNMLGAKLGKTSKYHYVFWSNAINMWTATIGNDVRKKCIGQFENEEECALATDLYLDEVDDEKRPRNRSEFAEIRILFSELATAGEAS